MALPQDDSRGRFSVVVRFDFLSFQWANRDLSFRFPVTSACREKNISSSAAAGNALCCIVALSLNDALSRNTAVVILLQDCKTVIRRRKAVVKRRSLSLSAARSPAPLAATPRRQTLALQPGVQHRQPQPRSLRETPSRKRRAACWLLRRRQRRQESRQVSQASRCLWANLTTLLTPPSLVSLTCFWSLLDDPLEPSCPSCLSSSRFNKNVLMPLVAAFDAFSQASLTLSLRE